MSILDWADPEEMVGLLAEYVRDEVNAEQHDRARRRFLRALSSAVDSLALDAAGPTGTILDRLRDIYNEQPADFATDPVLTDVADCIEELSRIVAQSH